MTFTYDSFVTAIRNAVKQADPAKAIEAVLRETVADSAAVASAIPPRDEDELHLFEDASVSIWVCRFQPDVVMPAHEHKMRVWIAGFAGVEKNIMYRRTDAGLEETAVHTVRPGEVLAIGADAIHAVTAEGSEPSHALHVYLGELTQVERDLFDEATGKAVPFTGESFERLKKVKGS